MIPLLFADLSPFITNYNQSLDKVIDQCSANFQNLKRIKEDFVKKMDQFYEEADEMKKELANRTQSFKDKENQLNAQLVTKRQQLLALKGNTH